MMPKTINFDENRDDDESKVSIKKLEPAMTKTRNELRE